MTIGWMILKVIKTGWPEGSYDDDVTEEVKVIESFDNLNAAQAAFKNCWAEDGTQTYLLIEGKILKSRTSLNVRKK